MTTSGSCSTSPTGRLQWEFDPATLLEGYGWLADSLPPVSPYPIIRTVDTDLEALQSISDPAERSPACAGRDRRRPRADGASRRQPGSCRTRAVPAARRIEGRTIVGHYTSQPLSDPWPDTRSEAAAALKGNRDGTRSWNRSGHVSVDRVTPLRKANYMQPHDFIDAAGGSGRLVAILAVSVIAALICLAISASGQSAH